MKYLTLEFKNAGWFYDVRKSSDRIFDELDGYKNRNESETFIEPITVFHLSNMLHVLMGERPKPSLRKSYIETIPEIFEMANNAFIKLNNYKYTNDKGTFNIAETITIKKAVWNAFSKIDILYWKRIERYLSNRENLYNQFIELLNKVFNTSDITQRVFTECMAELIEKHSNNKDVIAFKEMLLTPKYYKTDLAKIMSGIPNYMSNNMASQLLINNAVDKIVRLSGSIIIPVEDEWVKKIENSKGFATLLDGGIVNIVSIIDEQYYNPEIETIGYQKVSELSTLKKLNTKK